MAGVGLDQLVGQAKAAAKVNPPGLVGDERIRPALEGETIHTLGPDHPANPILRFEDHDLDRMTRRGCQLMDAMRRRQS